MSDPVRSAFNNVILLEFLTSVGLGALFFVALEHLVGAVWSTPFRRIFEILSAVLLILPLVALPIFFHVHDIFHWTHTDVVAVDEILQQKSPYLNMTFFTIRIIVYFAIWIIFYWLLIRNSKKQDKTKDQKITRINARISAVFMPIFAFTITFSSIDWLMSLEPHWFSTIFGVYYFSGTVVVSLAVGTLLVIWLNEKGLLVKGIKKDHYYSLGALLFAFINFWAYIAFSQYLLIWYANLPEETFWFIQKWEGSWMIFSIIFLIVHFGVPYFGLLSQPSKMDPKRLKFMSAWLIFAHIMDLYWIVMPTFSPDSFVFGWIEIGFIILGIGIVMVVFYFKARNTNLVAIGDPKLQRGIDFRL
ncbi:MAG: quinol:cytochrome C oxidoreductase [Chlorobi bacterium]|nr:quinol:cytochrome C oxidoreductase [Chlorobiota bacterium]